MCCGVPESIILCAPYFDFLGRSAFGAIACQHQERASTELHLEQSSAVFPLIWPQRGVRRRGCYAAMADATTHMIASIHRSLGGHTEVMAM